jgi:hypothetical protein
MKPALCAFATVMFAGLAVPQDLPPGILLLSRVKAHMNDELRRLTTLTCIETVERQHQAPRGKMQPLDTIRLEVLTNGDKELFASPGGRKFSENHPMSYAGSGALGDGLFGSYLKEILLSDSIASGYKGEEEIGGRRLARYDYRIPLLISGQMIRTPEGSGKVGLHGSYWADPQTYDVVRLQMAADEFPPSLPVTEMTTSIDYARTRVGNDLMVLLPETARMRLAKYSGEADENRVEFTHCRIFGSDSTLSFDAADSPEPTARFGSAFVDDTLRPLQSGLEIAVKLRTPITGDMAVGTLIDGEVGGNVMVKHVLAIPDGSPVRGRIRRLERYAQPFPYYVVGLEFTEVEIQGVRYVFYADLLNIDPAPGIEQGLSTKNTTTTIVNPFVGDMSIQHVTENFSLPKLPGVATFFYKGDKLALPPDLRTFWKTLPLR